MTKADKMRDRFDPIAWAIEVVGQTEYHIATDEELNQLYDLVF